MRLVEFPVALFAAPTYLAERKAPNRPADLAHHSIVAVSDSAGAQQVTLTDQRGRTASLTLRPVIRSGDFASAARLIEGGGGIGGLPDIVALAGSKAGRLIRVLPDWTLARAKLHAISLGGRQAPARVRVFREFVRERLAAASQH